MMKNLMKNEVRIKSKETRAIYFVVSKAREINNSQECKAYWNAWVTNWMITSTIISCIPLNL